MQMVKNKVNFIFLVFLLMYAGCEWESGDSFNTSKGAGVFVNFSGVYLPRDSEFIAGTNVTRLIIRQTGNVIEAYDNNGSRYEGKVGTPEIISPGGGNTGIYPDGADMVQTHIWFSGRNKDSRKDVNFVGLLRVVAITEIKADETTIQIQEGELTKTVTYTFNITESSARYVLEGNWIEAKKVSWVSAWARASGGQITFSDTIPVQPTPWTQQPQNQVNPPEGEGGGEGGQ